MKCRHCARELQHTFLDLGFAPPSNAYLSAAQMNRPETHYPLKVRVCDGCWLVQTEDVAAAEDLFRADYAYYSSTSASWLEHARRYADSITAQLRLDARSLVIEVASNDGYLLRNFVERRIPCLGIEPTAGTAQAAERLGIPVLREFFGAALGAELARSGRRADLIVGNNVFAHVPDINDFALGLKAALKPSGTITLEFPHLMRLIEHGQFDTVYHEHFSYLSLYAARRILETAGLRVCHVEPLPTHGGSLRVHACHADDPRPDRDAVRELLAEEAHRGLQTLAPYAGFQGRADRVKDELLSFLLAQKRAGRRVAAYGAAAKGNTLLNYAGVRPDLLPFVCDAAAAKQGRFLPGSHIPILAPAVLAERRPDYLLVLPWNLCAEVRRQNEALERAGTRFVVAIPSLEIL